MPKGYPINPEKTSLLRSIAAKNRIWTEETRQKVREMLIKRNKSKKHIEKVKKALKGHGFSEETLQKMRENHSDTKGVNNPRWKGGIFLSKTRGYKFIYAPYHEFRNEKGYVREHLFVLYGKVNGLKRNSIIHHIDGNKSNNEISNLMVMKDPGAHRRIHCNKTIDGDILFDGRK